MRISWEGMVNNADCADSMRVKYWLSSGSDTNFVLSEKMEKTARSAIVRDLSPYRDYTFQVKGKISRHEKLIHLEVSPTRTFC